MNQWLSVIWILGGAPTMTAQAADTATATMDTTRPAERVTPARTMTDLLVGRFPGVVVYPSTGLTGAANRVRIRGHGSLYLGNRPVVYVDGVRIEGMTHDRTLFDRVASPFDDLNPDDVDSIVIVRGPAAGGVYGPEAANGVILVYTKRGEPGAPRWHGYAEEGRLWDGTDWPANYGGVDAGSSDSVYRKGGCTLMAEAGGRCTQDFVQSFSPLEARSQFRTAPRRRAGFSVAGGAGRVRYAGGADGEREAGIYELSQAEAARLIANGFEIRDHVREPSDLRRLRARASVGIQLSPTTVLDVWGSIGTHSLRPGPESGLLSVGLVGPSDPAVNDGWALRPGDLFQTERQQEVDHRGAGLHLTGRLNRFLTVSALAGWHRQNVTELVLNRTGEGPQLQPGFGGAGARAVSGAELAHRTLSLDATAEYPMAGLGARSTLGIRHTKREVFDSSRQEIWRPGATEFSDSIVAVSASWRHEEAPLLAFFAAQRLDWRKRVAVTLGVRADHRDIPRVDLPFEPPRGGGSDWLFHPTVQVDWSAARPAAGILNRLDLRVGFGTADQRFPFESLLKPERTAEIELGARAELAESRTALDATFYARRLTNGIAWIAVAPSTGGLLSYSPARIHNTGVELGIRASPLRGERVSWDLWVSAWGNRNRARNLPPFVSWVSSVDQRMVEKYPLGGYWGFGYTYQDANADGVIERAEVLVDSVVHYLGNPFPSHGASWWNSVRVLGRIRVSGLFEYRAGHQLLNLTAWGRCVWGVCPELFDRSTSLDRQAAAVVGGQIGLGAGFIENADFVKLRELAFTVDLPRGVASRIGARSASVTVAGRNLMTWTGYSGADPEVIGFMRPEETNRDLFAPPTPVGFAVEDYMVQPAPRIWTLRLDVRF